MRDAGFDERMGVLDTIYEEEAAARPWVRFLDSRPVLSPDGGGYQATTADGTSLRQGDGIHLDRGGADLLAEAIFSLVDEVRSSGGG
jgi:lysophospholipase L1-like esterase